MANIIELKGITFCYESTKPVLENLNLEIKRGTHVVILGANGSGKSTLAKITAGLLIPAMGQIYIDGQQMNNDNVYELRKRIGIVFQNPDNQFVGATVEDDIAFGLENLQIPHDEMKDIIVNYSTLTKMNDFLGKEPSNLSGGQKQRVAIASVLAMSPQILILDEATSMLDPKGKNEIKDLILSMRQSRPDLTIISITHDVIEAQKADCVIILHEGKIFAQGQPREVLDSEEKLKAISLHLPFHYRLKQLLIEKGLPMSSDDEEGMVEELCQFASKM